MIKQILSFLLAVSLGFPNFALAADNSGTDPFTVHKEDPQSKSGSIFYSSTKKNEVLFKANIWGAVQFPGVHFMPLGTRFLDAISFAGGPIDAANPDQILLSSKSENGQLSIRELSVTKALASQDFNPTIQPEDIIVVKENHTRDNITLWIAIGTFVMSTVVFGYLVTHNP